MTYFVLLSLIGGYRISLYVSVKREQATAFKIAEP